MAIPDYQKLMLPMLKILSDNLEHNRQEVIDSLATFFGLTESERKELLPSGKRKFNNRVSWARTYLEKAGLLQSTGRGKFCITERGKDVLMKNPPEITNKYLSQFQEFKDFLKPSNETNNSVAANEYQAETSQTPEEVLEESYIELRRSLAVELLQRVKGCSPAFFEKLVVELIVAMGYGGSMADAGQAIGHSGDEGIDGIIKEDRLGLDVIYLQAKRWEGTVGRPIVQAFAGSLEGQRARKGILITTSRFSQEAKEYVTKIEKKIVLIDGEQLASLMIDFNIGVSEVTSYVVKKADLDYFEEL